MRVDRRIVLAMAMNLTLFALMVGLCALFVD